MQPARAKKVAFEPSTRIIVVQKDHACIRKVLATEEELVELLTARIGNLGMGSNPVFGKIPSNTIS
jgi:hypothetical protein